MRVEEKNMGWIKIEIEIRKIWRDLKWNKNLKSEKNEMRFWKSVIFFPDTRDDVTYQNSAGYPYTHKSNRGPPCDPPRVSSHRGGGEGKGRVPPFVRKKIAPNMSPQTRAAKPRPFGAMRYIFYLLKCEKKNNNALPYWLSFAYHSLNLKQLIDSIILIKVII